MSELQFDKVRTVIYDPQYMHRQVTLGAVKGLGFSQVEPVSRTEDLMHFISCQPYELLLAELHGSEAEVCDIVRRIRHRMIGLNPFVVILLTTWDLNAEAVRAVLNSGADDLLARPYTIAQLQQRLTAAAHTRKPFVVTADYVGPSRRNSARPAPDVESEVFLAPNPFRARVLGEEPGPAPEIDTAWRTVMRWKAIRLARQLESWSLALRAAASPSDIDALGTLVQRMVSSSVDLQGYALRVDRPAFNLVADHCAELQLVSARPLDEENLRRFTEVAALITHQVRLASNAEPSAGVAGSVPFYVG